MKIDSRFDDAMREEKRIRDELAKKRKENKKNVFSTLRLFNVQCKCLSSSFSLTADNYVICQNCKRLHRVSLEEVK